MDESNSSADNALTLAIGFVAAYLASPCWAVGQEMPTAKIVRNFAVGLATLTRIGECRFHVERRPPRGTYTILYIGGKEHVSDGSRYVGKTPTNKWRTEHRPASKNTIDNSLFSYRSSQHDKPMQ